MCVRSMSHLPRQQLRAAALIHPKYVPAHIRDAMAHAVSASSSLVLGASAEGQCELPSNKKLFHPTYTDKGILPAPPPNTMASTPPAHGTGRSYNEGLHEPPRVQLFREGVPLSSAEGQGLGTPLRKRRLEDATGTPSAPSAAGRRASEPLPADGKAESSAAWALESSLGTPEAHQCAPSLLPSEQGSPERGALSAASSPGKEAHSSAGPGLGSSGASQGRARHAPAAAAEHPARGAVPGKDRVQPAAPRSPYLAAASAMHGADGCEGAASGGVAAGAPAAWDPAQSLASLRHEFGEHGGVNMSIENSATFTVMAPETMARIFKGEVGPDDDSFVYSRHYNPTVMHLGRQLAALEGTESGYCTASGMAAISGALFQLTSSGDHIVASNRLYGGSYALLAHFLPKKCGITTTFVDIKDLAAVDQALAQSPRARAVFTESLSNPTLVAADIRGLAAVAHRRGVQLVVDNTFAPVLLSPARLGADVVVHSLSKFISGGSDIIAGCVCASAEFISGMMNLMDGPFMIMGATMNPQVAFQISSRLPHLALRMREHGIRAQAAAEQLQAAGLSVVYPGLASHPQHELLRSMLNPGYGFGGMLCVDLGTSARAYEFMDHLQNDANFGYMAVSLGYHDTLMSCSGASTSSEMGSEELAAVGISPGLVRLSVGFTGALPQRQSQLKVALRALGYW